MLLPRFLTALIGIPLFLAAIYFGGLPLMFIVLALVWIAVREFYRLAEETGYPCYPWLGQLGALLMTLSIMFNGTSLGASLDHLGTPLVFAVLLGAVFVRSLMRGPSETSLAEWSVTVFGWLYVGWTLPHLLLLRDLRPFGLTITLLFILLIWTTDTAAYFVGSRFGKHRLAPSISPKKSWEGTLGGVAGAMGVAWFFQMIWLHGVLSPLEAVLLGAATAGVATLSDLIESLLKRGAGVKDSSALLPGHGGILDRFDSVLLALPFFYYYWAILKF